MRAQWKLAIALVVCIVVIVAIGGAAFAQAARPPVAQSGSGRFVALQPPQAGDSTLQNFMWVLDTQTGNMRGYRIVKITEENSKDVAAWVTEQLLTEDEYYRLKRSK